MEPRTLLSTTYLVDVTTDSNPGGGGVGVGTTGDLRFCMTQADSNTGSTIDFSVTGTIQLAAALPNITANMTISGPGASSLEVSGGGSSNQFSDFWVEPGVTASISGLTIANGHFSNGGGLLNEGSTTLSGDVFNNDSGPGGGAVYNHFAPAFITATNCVFSNDTSTGNGGAYFSNGGGANFSGCTFMNDTTTGAGGAMFNTGALTVTNSTFTGDVAATFGGGIFNEGTLTAVNDTLTGNSAGQAGGGGGGFAQSPSGGSTTLENTLVAGNVNGPLNSLPVVPDDGFGPVVATSDHNLIGSGNNITGISNGSNGNQIGTQVSPINPMLMPLANNGGPTPTFALLPGSPAIDAGNNADATAAGLTTDQRGAGFARIADGGTGAGSVVDIGAFEVQDLVVNSTADTLAAGTLRSAITAGNMQGSVHISFDPTTFPSSGSTTIQLTSALPMLMASFNITGPNTFVSVPGPTAASAVVISGGGPSSGFSDFWVASGATSVLQGLTISNGNFTDGGGVINLGHVTLNLDVFSNNTAINGAAVYSHFGNVSLTVTNTTFNNNTALDFGGAVFTNGGTVSISSSTFNNNVAQQSGGGIYNGATGTIVNSTFSGNTATLWGGGLFNVGNLTLTNDTIANNTVLVDHGGGFVQSPTNGGSLLLQNTIVAGNVQDPAVATTPDDGWGAVLSTSDHNLIGAGDNITGISNGSNGNQIGTSGSPINPMLGPLANNGGPTETMALLAGSPAIDAGNNADAIAAGLVDDQRGPGHPRIENGVVDIGAYEFGS